MMAPPHILLCLSWVSLKGESDLTCYHPWWLKQQLCIPHPCYMWPSPPSRSSKMFFPYIVLSSQVALVVLIFHWPLKWKFFFNNVPLYFLISLSQLELMSCLSHLFDDNLRSYYIMHRLYWIQIWHLRLISTWISAECLIQSILEYGPLRGSSMSPHAMLPLHFQITLTNGHTVCIVNNNNSEKEKTKNNHHTQEALLPHSNDFV